MPERKLVRVAAVTLIFILLSTVAAVAITRKAKIRARELGDLRFEEVDPSSLSDVALRNWYNNSFKKAGIYSETVKNFKYILVSAGEKSTGGYSLSMAGVIGRPGEILIYAVIVPPKNSQIVNGPSYPHALIRIKEDGREVFLGGLREPDEKELEPPKVQVRPRSTYVLYKEPNPGKILHFRSTFQGIPPSWEVVGGTMAEVLESQGEWVI